MKNTLFSRLFSATLALTFGPAALSSEIDSFTRRFEPLEDAAPIINKKANELFAGALARANSQGACSEKAFFTEVKKEFDIILREGRLVNFIVTDPSVPRHNIARSESIYKYHRITDGYLLARPAADRDGIGMGMTLNFAGHYVGSDKFEHMFGQGHIYYNLLYNKKQMLAEVLNTGVFNERTYLGGNPLATGVFTYADLVANFNGMRFWNHLLQKHEDILGVNLGPYVVCENKKWVQVKKIDFGLYLDEGSDEGINCSSIVTSHGFEGVMTSLKELNEKHRTDRFRCPVDPQALNEIKKKYDRPVIEGQKAKISEFMFNPKNTINEYEIFWTPGLTILPESMR